MSHPAPENRAFLKAWRAFIGDDRPVYAPMVAAMLGFRMWCEAVTAAGTTATAAVRQYMLGQTEIGPCGSASTIGVNHHIEMAASVGRATREGQFEVVWRVPRPIAGDPWAAASIIADATAANAQRDLLDALPTPLIVLDDGGDVRYRSASTHEYFGPEISAGVLATLREMVAQLDAAPAESHRGPLPAITIHDAGGRARHMTIAARRMIFAGDPAHLLSLADVTYIRGIEEQLLILNAELQCLATTDPLTGVSNRRHFVAAVASQLESMRRHRRAAVMFILDLDHFKLLNDRHGHEVGDHALIEAATTLHRLMRGNDIFARIGGEEFAGFLPETELGSALVVAERLRAGIAGLRIGVGDAAAVFTCSIGLTAVDADTDTPESAMKRANAGLYLVKHEGRDRVLWA